MRHNAEEYASKLGWYTFPVNRDKTPRTKHGCNDATLDTSKFNWKGANLGIATGPSHLVVVDIDGPEGLAEWREIAEEVCPTGVVVRTSKGVHLYFSDPQSIYATGHLAPHVDVRGVGGYVVVPPSTHESGHKYTWLKSTFPPPPPPEWLAGLLPRLQEREVGGSSDDPTVQLLLEHQWVVVGGNEVNIYLRRPGKLDKGHSATWNGTVFFVHTTEAAPFEEGHAYTAMGVSDILRGPQSPWRVGQLEVLWDDEAWNEFFVLLATSGTSAQEGYRQKWMGRKGDWDFYVKAGRRTSKEAERKAKKEAKKEEALFYIEDMIALYEVWGFRFQWNEDSRDTDLNGHYFDDKDYDLLRAKIWDWQQDNSIRLPENLFVPALKAMAVQNPYSPLKDHLEKVKWDGIPRIARLATYFKAEGDQALLERFITHWIVGNVARVYEVYQNPMLVLSGPQGVGKSYFPKWLASGFESYYYAGSVFPNSKDCRLRRCTTWIWEVEELGATTRKTDVGALKAFITQDQNKDRKSYGRRDVIGRCIASFVGTVNTGDFLSDETGNRRFLPCAIEGIDWAYVELDVGQIWAEALATYRRGNDWRLSAEDLRRQRVTTARHLSGGAVEEFLPKFLEVGLPGESVSLVDILVALQEWGIRPSRGTKADVTRALKSWGAVKKRPSVDNVRSTRYFGVKWRVKGSEGQREGQQKTTIYGVLDG